MSGVSESEMMSHTRDHPEESEQHAKNNSNNNQLFTSLGRQSSIYSLTLDEFQHTLCENGKNFGSMNMDEFLNSIWTAEENQANTSTHHGNTNNVNANLLANNTNNANQHNALGDVNVEKKGMIARQQSLARQGSLTLPAPLCRKTVEEVWSEIHKGHKPQAQQQQTNNNNSHTKTEGAPSSEHAARQPTLGEMTLEDFLVKSGVVREPDSMSLATPLPPQLQYGMVGQNYMMGMGAIGGGASTSNAPVVPNYQAMAPQGGGAGMVGESSSGYVANGKRNNGVYAPPPSQGVCFGGRMVNGGGYAPTQAIGMAAPVSPVSSDGMCAMENSGGQYGMEMGGLRGRKRILDGPVEKVVERRQRRMIKNRESAAKSRARKQAYTVELEAELNQLREENANLKQALADVEMKQRQQYSEDTRKKAQSRAQKAMEKLWTLKRSYSCAV